jgi:hypothetical protein
MPIGYSGSPQLLKGALIEFSASLLVPNANLIVFQYNPETLARSLAPWAPPTKEDREHPDDKLLNQLKQPYDPQETFTLQLELDAADSLESVATNPGAAIYGIADRLSALEMLMYPEVRTPANGLNVPVDASLQGGPPLGPNVQIISQARVPVVLFSWGPGRIVPVRVESFSVDEQAFLPTLYPLRAKVSLGLKILDNTAFLANDNSAPVKLAKACYAYTLGQKKGLAGANMLNSLESLLPF